MSVVWVQPEDSLPLAQSANEYGLVAAGLDLSPQRLYDAYREGLFPWYNSGDPVLWWSTDPRMVLYTHKLHLSRSLQKKIRQIQRAEHTENAVIQVSCNLAFRAVIEACASSRAETGGTWISEDIINVYHAMHQQGFAHSIETWVDGELAGGLYGLNIGGVFFGESMFAYKTDASKISLVYLVDILQRAGLPIIDCQQETAHLASLGAEPIARAQFIEQLYLLRDQPQRQWPTGYLRYGQTRLGNTTSL